MQKRTIGPREARWLILVAASGPLWLGTEGAAQTFETKVNWDVGEARVFGDQTFNLTYGDYHVKFATPGRILNDPAPTTANGDFDNATPTVTQNPFPADDCLTIDWAEAGGGTITGKNHIGATFHIRNTGGAGVRTVESRLTNVTMTGPGGMVGPFPTLDTPGGTPRYKKVNSAEVTFSVDNPAIVGPVTFSDVSFYQTSVEPPLEALNAFDFVALPKTFLMSVPTFDILELGSEVDILVGAALPKRWLITVFTTTWENPVLSTAVGAPTTISVDTWYAEQLIPEPNALVLLILGGLAVLSGRRGHAVT